MDMTPSEAGPSRLPAHPVQSPTHTDIPAYGPEFFEYRRRLFLAGHPLPPNPPSPIPKSYTVPLPFPDPIPAPPNNPGPTVSSVGKLEALLQEEGAEETMAAWTAGLAGVHARLDGGKRLSRPLKLGLVIKVLKAGWIRDGTWPTDPTTRRAARPPSSPTLTAQRPQTNRKGAPSASLPPMPPMKVTRPRPPTPLPTPSDLPPTFDAPPLPSFRSGPLISQQRQHDPARDVKVGGDVWRGAKRDAGAMNGSGHQPSGDHG